MYIELDVLLPYLNELQNSGIMKHSVDERNRFMKQSPVIQNFVLQMKRQDCESPDHCGVGSFLSSTVRTCHYELLPLHLGVDTPAIFLSSVLCFSSTVASFNVPHILKDLATMKEIPKDITASHLLLSTGTKDIESLSSVSHS